MRYEATHLRKNLYAVRPAGVCGTCGWINGEAWQVTYINARNAPQAMLKFHCSRGEAIVEKAKPWPKQKPIKNVPSLEKYIK